MHAQFKPSIKNFDLHHSYVALVSSDLNTLCLYFLNSFPLVREIPQICHKKVLVVTYIKTVINPSLSCFLYFSSRMTSNNTILPKIGYRWRTFEGYVWNSAGICGRINRTGKRKWIEIRNFIYFINLIKGRNVIFQGTSVSWKRIVEEI